MHRLAVVVALGAAGCEAFGTGSDRFEQVFLSLEHLPVVEIELDRRAEMALRAHPRTYVWGEVGIDGDWVAAEVRLKGNGSFEPFDDKPSFKIKFDGDWYGYDRLILNNYSTDPSQVHERLATEAFHMMRLPAARAGYADVRVNGVSKGVYGALEDVDQDLLRRWFPREDGSLYEMSDGDFEAGLLDGLEHEEGPRVPALLRHIAEDLAAGEAVGFELAEQHFDADAFLAFWATTAVVAQTDAFPYSVPGDDVYLYLDPDTEQFHFIPHGLDEAFLPRGRTIGRTTGLLARRCLTNAECRFAFEQQVDRVFRVLQEQGFEARANELVRHARNWRTDRQRAVMERHDQTLKNWLTLRRATLDEELP
ncbi:MAG: CotH kinase family protein [Myxococcales bacterium]|nr:CotH kinase family protein [Myxococcales bacterium]